MEAGTPNIYELFLIFLHRLVNDTFDKGGHAVFALYFGANIAVFVCCAPL